MTYAKKNGTAVCSVSDCQTRIKGHGLCQKHYFRARRAGTLPPPQTEWERFWEKVEIGDCWEWMGAKTAGYGCFGSRNGPGSKLAHRWTWENLVGPVPAGLELDHLCRNRACCNPDHLEPVTRRVNQLRGAPNVVHHTVTHCLRGHLYDDENTGINNRGRYCRACKRAWMRDYYQRKTVLLPEEQAS